MARSAGLVPVRVEPKARGDVPEGCRGQPTPKALARPAGLEPAAPGLEGPSSGTIGHKNGYQQLERQHGRHESGLIFLLIAISSLRLR
jgi:hypothetical protein